MSALARRILRFHGVPAAQAAELAGMSTEDLQRARRSLDRDPDDGTPRISGRAGLPRSAEPDTEHERFDVLMRSNRGVRGL